MSLINCPECGQKVSDTTKNCIHCGFELPKKEVVNREQEPEVRNETESLIKPKKKKLTLWVFASLASVIAVCIVLFIILRMGGFFKGAIAYSKGDYSNAVRYLSESEFTFDKNLLPKAKIALYNLAQNKLESGNWDEAIELLTGFEYQDSDVLLASATRSKGMSEKADFAFLESLEESISRRMEINAKESSDFRTLVTTELAYVEKYYSEDFYDPELAKLARKYIDGLNLQKSSLTEDFHEDQQSEWQRGMVERFEVLNELYEKYDFCSDNKDFVGEYISQLSSQKTLLKAYDEIKELLTNQLWKANTPYKWTKNSLTFNLKNTTHYTFDVTFYYYFSEAINITNKGYDYGKQFYNSEVSINGIKPGQSFQVEFYFGSSNLPKNYALSRCDWTLFNVN